MEDNKIPTRIRNPETSPENIADIKNYATIMKGNIRYIVNRKIRVSDTSVDGVVAIVYIKYCNIKLNGIKEMNRNTK